MDKLLHPEIGLMIWTVITFAALAYVLARFAWKPILAALDNREDSIRQNIQSAETSKKAAEELRQEYESRLAGVEAKARELMSQAEAQARSLKDDLVRTAHQESEKLLEETRKKLADDERRLARDLRAEMAHLSLRATEKMLRRGLDKPFQDRLVQEALGDFEKWTAEKK
ncbi:MAG: F0F1 ATP synthase subunit B [Elusimicrobia bacterium]|nr:F0F1 ATP synthase subunit B [Elusimicrobiota bacterium]